MLTIHYTSGSNQLWHGKKLAIASKFTSFGKISGPSASEKLTIATNGR